MTEMLRRQLADVADKVPAEAWLGMPGLPLFENSAPVGSRGGVLTMLWAADLEAALI